MVQTVSAPVRTTDDALPAPAWHTAPPHEVGAHYGVDVAIGLSGDEAAARLARYGPNRLTAEKREPLWESILEEVREPMILLLLGTSVLYGLWSSPTDALIIVAIIAVVVGVEIYNERRAGRAIAALATLAEPTVPVRRAGSYREIPAEAVVPGDVLLLQEGRRVPADARLIEDYGLAADEAALTGESIPVEKEAAPTLPTDTPLAERRNLVFAGTAIARGRGAAVTVATGRETEVGHIARLAAGVEERRTPLQRTMRELTGWMIWVALGFSALVPLVGWLHGGQSPRQMLLTGLALAFATIPEELPILVTLVLGLGAYHLSRRHAIVKRLRAAETLSAVTVIATDKTGTLTENRMAVQRVAPPEQDARALTIGVLCNDAVENADGTAAGDPLELALLRAARVAALDAATLRRRYPVRAAYSFDSARQTMATVYGRDGALWIVAKGAPEAILARVTARRGASGETRPVAAADRAEILAAAAGLANDGLRVIACAEKTAPEPEGRLVREEVESGLVFVGLIGLADPPRPEVAGAIAACRAAGMRPLMITGDHPLTARAIARAVGLDEAGRVLTGPDLDGLSDAELRQTVGEVAVYARTTPAHKLRLVRALRDGGEVVAVTGDGVNDAPALAAADVGVAMGETGSDVAREAADIVLADDNFATIVTATREGRLLFANLRKAIRYYLACKVALVAATLLPVLLGVPVPFSPIQIILLELFMDVGAASTFVAERAETDLMRRPPRDARAPFMNGAMVRGIVAAAAGLCAAVAVAYLVTLYGGGGVARAQTMAFVTWLLGHVLLALNLRAEREPLRWRTLIANRLMLLWGGAAVAVALLATLVPPAHAAFKTVALDGRAWALVVAVALLGTFWIDVRKRLARLSRRGRLAEHWT